MEKHFSVNAEGCSIRSKLYARDKDEIGAVILCGHGFGGHKDNKAAERFARRILEKNKHAAIVTFDLPCHGDDVRKTLRLEDCGTYLRLMISWIDAQYRTPMLFGYATSFGGYLFLKYISEMGNPFAKLALRCPAIHMYDVVMHTLMTEEAQRLIAKGKPAHIGFDRKMEIDGAFLEELRQADISRRDYLAQADDLLILHGAKDEIIPIDTVKAFAEENVIEFEVIENADHRFQDPLTMERANARIAAFFGMK